MQNTKWLGAYALAGVLLFGCGGSKRQKHSPDASGSAEPDKLLYDRAMDDLAHHRYEISRQTLQVLINTYPDSEYLAKAKLSIADSHFKESGISNLTQAAAEYKDFKIFFPSLDEAAYAQYQIAMCHYRQLEKPDRDRTQARMAEAELQGFLQEYPNHTLAPEAEQKLRDVQELLAEGDFRIAHYYYVKGSLRAAGARLLDLTARYPLYSQADKANWMLGQVFERAEKSDVAARFYARIVREYPLSDLVPNAKEKLAKLGVPVPQPDPEAVARMKQEQEVERGKTSLVKKPLGIFKSSPNVRMAARHGAPTLTPESEAIPLLPEGPTSNPGMSVAGGTAPSTAVAIVPSGTGGTTTTTSPTGTGANATAGPPGTTGAGTTGDSNTTDTNAAPKTDPKAAPDPCKTDDKGKGDDKSKQADKNKNCKESTSKKKSGIKKIIPW